MEPEHESEKNKSMARSSACCLEATDLRACAGNRIDHVAGVDAPLRCDRDERQQTTSGKYRASQKASGARLSAFDFRCDRITIYSWRSTKVAHRIATGQRADACHRSMKKRRARRAPVSRTRFSKRDCGVGQESHPIRTLDKLADALGATSIEPALPRRMDVPPANRSLA
jgi:hypothetical protein